MKSTTSARPAANAGPSRRDPRDEAVGSGAADVARRPRTVPRFLLPLVTTVLLIGVVEALSRTGVLPPELTAPTDTLGWLIGQAGVPAFWIAVGDTLSQTLLGVLLGSAAGMGLGLLMGEIPILHRLFQGSLEFLRPIPVIVYLPLLILVSGAEAQTAVVLIAVAVVWPMLYQTMYGVRAVDGLLTDAGRVFGLSARQRLVHVTIPSISPYLATGLRISLSLALVVSVAIGLISGVPGLGWSLTQYQTAGNYPAVYGVVIVTGVLGVLLNQLMLWLEKPLLRWHVSHRSTGA